MDSRGAVAWGAINHMKKKGTFKVVLIGIALGVVLLLAGSFFFSERDSGDKNTNEENMQRIDFLDYKESIIREIESICLEVKGIRSARAVVFFDGVGESVYAQNTQSGSQEKVEYVIIGSGSNAHALYIGESLPDLSGIGVVCDTGGNESLKNEIAALLSAAYGLPLTRVYVSEG